MSNEESNKELAKNTLWEQLYVKSFFKELRPSGRILQIGFSSDLVAEAIQQFPLKSHTIVEVDGEKFQEAVNFSKSKSYISVYNKPWQEILPTLGEFDLIVFAEQTEEDKQILNRYLNVSEAAGSNAEVQEILKKIEEQMAKVGLSYTDQAIEEFMEKTGRLNTWALPQFFQKLIDNKNITQEQYDKIVKKYELNAEKEMTKPLVKQLKRENRKLACLQLCLKKNMVKGSRFTYFLSNAISEYDNSEFFDQVITNSHLDYQEKVEHLDVKGQLFDALIPVVTLSS